MSTITLVLHSASNEELHKTSPISQAETALYVVSKGVLMELREAVISQTCRKNIIDILAEVGIRAY